MVPAETCDGAGADARAPANACPVYAAAGAALWFSRFASTDADASSNVLVVRSGALPSSARYVGVVAVWVVAAVSKSAAVLFRAA
jgi:hypothetical protein